MSRLPGSPEYADDPPPLPQPKIMPRSGGKRGSSKSGAPARRVPEWARKRGVEDGKGGAATFAWQPTDFSGDDAGGDDVYNWEYFLDSNGAPEDQEFDELFQENRKGEEYTVDRTYKSDAYDPKKSKNKDRSCAACRDDRMCKMERCAIS